MTPDVSRPLEGRRIVVTRSADQAGSLAQSLRALGATPLLVPAIRSAPSPDPAALAEAAGGLGSARWLGFTSPSGVRHGWPAVEASWPDGLPSGLGVAAVGPGTAEALAEFGARPSFVPSESAGDAFAAELQLDPGDRVVLMRSDIARRAVADDLRQRGAQVLDAVAYQTVEGADPDDVRRALDAGADAVTFTSPSTVRGFLDAFGVDPDGGRNLPRSVALTAIGPVTAAEVRRYGLPLAAVADSSTIPGLVDALVTFYA